MSHDYLLSGVVVFLCGILCIQRNEIVLRSDSYSKDAPAGKRKHYCRIEKYEV